MPVPTLGFQAGAIQAVKLVPLAFIWIQGTELDLEAGSGPRAKKCVGGWGGVGGSVCNLSFSCCSQSHVCEASFEQQILV